MSRKEVFVIRIGISLESVGDADRLATPGNRSDIGSEPEPKSSPRMRQPESQQRGPMSALPAKPERFRGRDNHPQDARQGDSRAMSSEQRRTLFRLSYTLGDREGALSRVLDALGVDRLEWATRADAALAIDRLRGKPEPIKGPTNGARHG